MLGQTIGYIDYAFGRNDNIGIGIGYNRLYRLCLGQQSVISIMLGPTIDYIDYAWTNNRYNRLWKKKRSLVLLYVIERLGWTAGVVFLLLDR